MRLDDGTIRLFYIDTALVNKKIIAKQLSCSRHQAWMTRQRVQAIVQQMHAVHYMRRPVVLTRNLWPVVVHQRVNGIPQDLHFRVIKQAGQYGPAFLAILIHLLCT